MKCSYYICDLCGKKLANSQTYHLSIDDPNTTVEKKTPYSIDLCEKCHDKLEDFLKGRETE